MEISQQTEDLINHPSHYTSHPSGIECIQITEHFNFNLSNAIKYIWRSSLKGNVLENLRKAQFYINREIARLDGHAQKGDPARNTYGDSIQDKESTARYQPRDRTKE